ncbi:MULTISPECIES: glycosyltransferase family 4 protein [Weeksellaceae]|uniref:glycosyltransferase family 4 protein n=1 Tax=Weeksellaceae TaxID=2762318 RepID=UPI002FC5FDFA
MKKIKNFRISTVPVSLNILLKGQLKFLSNHFAVTAISGAGKDLDEVVEREGVKTYAIEIQRNISPFKDIVSLIQLYFYFKKEKPLIVHSITPKAGLLSMIAAKFADVPIRMHTFTGLIFPSKSGLLQKILIKMDQLLCWSATNIYPEGNGVKNDLINYKITSKPLNILANGNVNGIDLEYFALNAISNEQQSQLKKELHIQEKDFIFIFVGRLVSDKGINELIQAFSKLKIQNSKLLLVGPLESDLDPLRYEILKEIETNPNIISVGFQKDVRPYFAISDCLVFPSYREGFPNVVMQAGAMGLPSIVSNINGCNEIIIEGENGTIIPVKDSEAIKSAMLKMIEDKEFYFKLKENSRSMIQSRYEQAVVWQALLEEYTQLLKEKKLNV